MRSYFVELQSYWIEYVFSVGDVAGNDYCWETMSKIAFLLPQKDNPAVSGFKLDALSNDYEQLEKLFFCQGKTIAIEEVHGYEHNHFIATVNTDEFVAAAILNLHKFNPKRIIVEAWEMQDARVREREQVKKLDEIEKENAVKALSIKSSKVE